MFNHVKKIKIKALNIKIHNKYNELFSGILLQFQHFKMTLNEIVKPKIFVEIVIVVNNDLKKY